MRAVTVFVLDRSGSMAEKIQGANGRKIAKIQALKEAMRTLLLYKAKFFPQDLIGCVAFGNHAQVLFKPTVSWDRAIWKKLEKGLKVNRERTNMTEGLSLAIELLKDQPSGSLRNIVLLSDGCANEGNPELLVSLAMYAYANRINIHTIGFGDGLTDFDEKLLIRIARLTHRGKYQHCRDIHQLVRAFRAIR